MKQIRKVIKILPEVSILVISIGVACYSLWTGHNWRGDAKYTDVATFIVLAITLNQTTAHSYTSRYVQHAQIPPVPPLPKGGGAQRGGISRHCTNVMWFDLAALVFYARDTHRIANATEAKWMFESRPRLDYYMGPFKDSTEPYSDKVIFTLINPSDSILKAWVRCNFRIYGNPVEGDDAFNGCPNMWPSNKRLHFLD